MEWDQQQITKLEGFSVVEGVKQSSTNWDINITKYGLWCPLLQAVCEMRTVRQRGLMIKKCAVISPFFPWTDKVHSDGPELQVSHLT